MHLHPERCSLRFYILICVCVCVCVCVYRKPEGESEYNMAQVTWVMTYLENPSAYQYPQTPIAPQALLKAALQVSLSSPCTFMHEYTDPESMMLNRQDVSRQVSGMIMHSEWLYVCLCVCVCSQVLYENTMMVTEDPNKNPFVPETDMVRAADDPRARLPTRLHAHGHEALVLRQPCCVSGPLSLQPRLGTIPGPPH